MERRRRHRHYQKRPPRTCATQPPRDGAAIGANIRYGRPGATAAEVAADAKASAAGFITALPDGGFPSQNSQFSSHNPQPKFSGFLASMVAAFCF
jgi:hypothetical protein